MTSHAYETHELSRFIRNHYAAQTQDGRNATMTGMGSIKGKWIIPDADYPRFLDLMYDFLFVKGFAPMAFVEQPRKGEPKPLLIDLDFKYPAGQALERTFDISHVHGFVRKYVENLTHFYELESQKPLRFFITLRPAPYEDKKTNTLNRSIKDGVHIECPDLVLPSEHQQVLRHRSIEHGNLATTFKNTGYINAEKDVFDEAIVKKNGWFFYGESKPDIPAYTLASVYVYDPTTGTYHEENKDNYTSRQLPAIPPGSLP